MCVLRLLIFFAPVCAGKGQVRIQDPPAWNGGAAKEVQCKEEAEG